MNDPSFDLQGCIDAHIHVRSAAALADLAAAGVPAARDAGSRNEEGLMLQRAPGPVRIRSAGQALVKQGGYGAFLGTPLAGAEAIVREISGLAGRGAAIIKVVASGVVSFERPEAVTAGGFDRKELLLIVKAAAEHGLGVMAHANGPDAISNAVAAGVRSIEHGFFMPEDALAEMARRRTFWVPTVGALRRAADAAGLGGEMRRSVERTLDRHLFMLKRAFELSVPLAVGTDAVLPDRRYGGWYQDELVWFRKAGIPGDDVERIATDGGKQLLDLT